MLACALDILAVGTSRTDANIVANIHSLLNCGRSTDKDSMFGKSNTVPAARRMSLIATRKNLCTSYEQFVVRTGHRTMHSVLP